MQNVHGILAQNRFLETSGNFSMNPFSHSRVSATREAVVPPFPNAPLYRIVTSTPSWNASRAARHPGSPEAITSTSVTLISVINFPVCLFAFSVHLTGDSITLRSIMLFCPNKIFLVFPRCDPSMAVVQWTKRISPPSIQESSEYPMLPVGHSTDPGCVRP